MARIINNKDLEKLEVKKLVSLNPDRYESWKFLIAMQEYFSYMAICMGYSKVPKTFIEWLETEI